MSTRVATLACSLLAAGVLALGGSQAPATAQVLLEPQSRTLGSEVPRTVSLRDAQLRFALAKGPLGAGEPAVRSLPPRTPFTIYVGIDRLATTTTSDGSLRGTVSVDVLLRAADGRVVSVRDGNWNFDVSFTAGTADPKSYANLYLKDGLVVGPGQYQLVIRVHDRLNGTFADQSYGIEIVGAVAPRLSQTSTSQ